MAFPRLEDHLDAPSQSVNAEDLLEARLARREVGDEDGPVHQLQHRLGRVVALGFLFGFINRNPLPSGGYIYVLYAGLVSSGLAFLLQLYGQKHVHPTVSGLLLTLESLFGALGAIIILHEPFTSRTLIGGGLMILAVVILELGPKMWLQFRGEMRTNGSI